MDSNDSMLEAHVQFELSRWHGAELSNTIDEEVTALFAWLDTVRLEDLVEKSEVTAVVLRAVDTVPVTDLVVDVVVAGLRAAHKVLRKDETAIADLISYDTFEAATDAAISLEDARSAFIDEVLANDVYAGLLSHVLYQGIKSYIQTENVITKKVPGASALMRASQSAISTAAPKLEKAIDKQLTAFVNSNVADSIRDSRQFLTKFVDDTLLRTVADSFWDANAKLTVSDFAQLVAVGDTDEFVGVARQGWAEIRQTETFANVVSAVVDDFFRTHRRDTVGKLLALSAVTPEVVIDLTEPLRPAIERAVASGYAESRIRARLGAFYEHYQGG